MAVPELCCNLCNQLFVIQRRVALTKDGLDKGCSENKSRALSSLDYMLPFSAAVLIGVAILQNPWLPLSVSLYPRQIVSWMFTEVDVRPTKGSISTLEMLPVLVTWALNLLSKTLSFNMACFIALLMTTSIQHSVPVDSCVRTYYWVLVFSAI